MRPFGAGLLELLNGTLFVHPPAFAFHTEDESVPFPDRPIHGVVSACIETEANGLELNVVSGELRTKNLAVCRLSFVHLIEQRELYLWLRLRHDSASFLLTRGREAVHFPEGCGVHQSMRSMVILTNICDG